MLCDLRAIYGIKILDVVVLDIHDFGEAWVALHFFLLCCTYFGHHAFESFREIVPKSSLNIPK